MHHGIVNIQYIKRVTMDDQVYINGAIYDAVQSRDYDKVMFLINQGEDIEEPGDASITPLALAVLQNKSGENNEIVCLLLDRGADPNVECGMSTVIGWTAYRRNAFIVNALLHAGALMRPPETSALYDLSINPPILHLAIQRSMFRNDHHDPHTENVVRVLLLWGVDVFALDDRFGKTATFKKPKHNNAWRIVHDMQERILVAVHDMRLRPMRIAMAMSQHDRLGSNSSAKCIDPELLRMILNPSKEFIPTVETGRYSRNELDDHVNFPATIEEQLVARQLTILHANDEALTEIEFRQLRALRMGDST
jgi:Ankyrin repeat